MQAHILVIDDEPGACRMIELMLKSKKYAATCVTNGQEGLNLLQQSPDSFHLILLDMMMPVMDGLEFMAGMNKEAGFKHIPVVLQTGTQCFNEINRALELGVRCCLRKPFSRTELINTIQLVLSGNTPIPQIISSPSFENVSEDIADSSLLNY